ncbi:MAG: glycosyltransferase family 4 protein [Pyrinomonadaceae bacterium]|nr:glycosyltransferase family 4 protein [Pyrinomonadaceae bacterium]
MHVLQLGPYPPPEGGISRNMLAIRDELLKSGHECSIIATAKSSEIKDEPNVYHPRTPREFIKLLKSLKYDILHVHHGGELPFRVFVFLWICAFFGRGKSVLTFHSGGYAVENVKTASYFSRDAFIFRRFRKIIAVNAQMVEMFGKFGVKKEKLEMILPFVLKNPEKSVEVPANLREFVEKHSPFLLTVCLLEDTYDLFLQIEAIEKVLRELPDAGLMIVGSGILEAELKRAIASKKYADRIYLAGNVENKITLHLIKKADILLRTTKFDGDAIAIREALFLETEVIATDNKMRPEGVHLIPIHDEKALVEKIIEVSEKEKLPRPEKADNTSNIEAVLKVYQQIFKG